MDNFDLRSALRQHRKRNNLSGKKMSELLGISKSTYQRRESGVTHPTYLQAIDMQRKLNLEWPLPITQKSPSFAEAPAPTPSRILGVPLLTIEDAPQPPLPPDSPPLKWFRPKVWRLMFPVYVYCLFSIIMDTRGFGEAVGGKEEIARHPMDEIALLINIVLTAIYWWFKPPELPFKLKATVRTKFIESNNSLIRLVYRYLINSYRHLKKSYKIH